MSTVARATWFSGMSASCDAVEVGEGEDLRAVVDELAVHVRDEVGEGGARVDLGRLAQADGEDVVVRHRRQAGAPQVGGAREPGDGRSDLAGVDDGRPPGPVLPEGPVVPLGE